MNVWCVLEQTTSDDIPLTSLEESLFSSEKLDRASPELWPEQSKSHFLIKDCFKIECIRIILNNKFLKIARNFV